MKTTQSVENIVFLLKEIISRKGPMYLTEEPFGTFDELMESEAVDRKTAAAFLYISISGLTEAAAGCSDLEVLSARIRKECSLNKKIADRLAGILLSLYSEDNRKEWRNRKHEGLKQFLKEEFNCTWEGFSVWDAGNGTVDCHYEARIVLIPTEAVAADEELSRRLKKNPFIEKDAIHDFFEERLKQYLDVQFDEYCCEDDYYQPVVEDFEDNLEYDLRRWCEENGFEFLSVKGEGADEGYEPKCGRRIYY